MYVEEMGGIENLGQGTLENYFDYQAFGRDLAMDIVMIEYNNGYLVKYY
jgi:antirestriction protein